MNRHFRQWFMAAAALVIVVLAVTYLNHFLQPGEAPVAPENPPSTQPKQNNSLPPSGSRATTAMDVKIISVSPQQYQASINAYGEAKAHYEMTITAEVSGKVIALSDQFETGLRLKQNDVLITIENTEYRAAVAAAELELNNAKVALLEEQRQGEQAKAEWAASGVTGEPSSDLVLRTPQLEAAKAEVMSAELALANAKSNLSKTRLSVPFNSVVVERLVAPGSYVQTGSEVATVFSTDRAEIRVVLSAQEWLRLPDTQKINTGELTATLTDIETETQWQGFILRADQHRDETTRQRGLVIAIDNPLDLPQALLPGTFLNVAINGIELAGLWQLPSSALSQRGEIWYVNEDDLLKKFSAEPRFSDENSIYITAPESLSSQPQRVLVHPLNTYVENTRVNSIMTEDNDNES